MPGDDLAGGPVQHPLGQDAVALPPVRWRESPLVVITVPTPIIVGGRPTLPASILTEAMAQTGAMLILSKPENRARLIYFMGIDRVRYRRPVVAGDCVMLEATVVRLRAKMGTLRGIARVEGHVVLEGQMTFALADRPA